MGKEKFATCYITAEYQYSIFKNGTDKNFDYTSVAVGYFKSVELLLEKILWTTLEKGVKTQLWIYGNKKWRDLKKDNISPKPKNKSLVPFNKEYKEYFATEMGSLINWLYNNKHGWIISNDGREKVYNILNNYKQGCRNEHLHKDLITDIKTLEAIKENTLLCLYYLIGSYVYSGNIKEDTQILGIENSSFNRLYNKLIRMPSHLEYIIQFDGSEHIRTKMLFHTFQPKPSYDERGSVKSCILFIKTPGNENIDWENYDSYIEKNRSNIIELSRDNCPSSIWWDNGEICKEILW